ncbi:hypothetical protein ES703_97596 [subsurface metagenome]
MHIEQSKVGNVLSSWAMRPPTDDVFSTSITLYPCSPSVKEASIPEIPPPITIMELSLFSVIFFSVSIFYN